MSDKVNEWRIKLHADTSWQNVNDNGHVGIWEVLVTDQVGKL